MKQTALAVLMSILLSGAAFGASAATAADETPTSAAPVSASGPVLARNGADDPLPPCDDFGTDVCATGAQPVAKNGADDPLPPCDDDGTDLCAIRAS